MKTTCFIAIALCSLLLSCSSLEETEEFNPIPAYWGPDTYQIDGILEDTATHYFTQVDSSGQLRYSPNPITETDLPFHFNADFFLRFPEIIISSPYPFRASYFQALALDCFATGNTDTGIEFTMTTAREKDYLFIARLDSAYWQCLKSTDQPVRLSFQLRNDFPVTPTPFSLRGFHNQQQGLVHIKAQKDPSGIWQATHDYQVFQEPGPKDFTIQVTQHPQLGAGQSLIRFSSSMQLIPQSVWIGLAGECLDQADWEVHRNRLNDRFLLDVVIPDCYLDCLNDVSDGFEFAVEFFQFTP